MHTQKRLAALTLVSIVLSGAGVVWADDALTQSAPTHQQLMKDCIRKHQAGDVSQSKSQLNRLCEDELKQQKVTGTPPPPAPPTDGPQQPQTPP